MSANPSEESLDNLMAKLREITAKRSAIKKGVATHSKGSKCIKKWIEIPQDKIDSYDTAHMTKCGTCRSRRNTVVYAIPYVVHDNDGDYICFKCGESCNINYMCPHCSGSLNKQLQRNNRDARTY